MSDRALIDKIIEHELWRGPDQEWVVVMAQGAEVYREPQNGTLWRREDGRYRPDPNDPATAGVLLSLVPMSQAYDDGVWPHGRHWRIRSGGGLFAGAVLGEVAIRAIAVAWGIT